MLQSHVKQLRHQQEDIATGQNPHMNRVAANWERATVVSQNELRQLGAILWALGPTFILLFCGALFAQAAIPALLLYQLVLISQGRTTIEGLASCNWHPAVRNVRTVMGPSVWMWLLPVSLSIPSSGEAPEEARLTDAPRGSS